MTSKKKKKEAYINKLELYTLEIKSTMKYSIERFDILIVSLSSGALGFSMAFVKDIVKDFSNISHTLLFITWSLFGAALIINLVSQISSFYSNRLDLRCTKAIISAENIKKKKPRKNALKKIESEDSKANLLDNITQSSNLISLVSFISGVICLIIFISNNL